MMRKTSASYKPCDPLRKHFIENCAKCGGSGRFRGWSGILNNNCSACKGEGLVAFKTSPGVRAAGRANAAAKRSQGKTVQSS